MLIQVHSDNNIEASASRNTYYQDEIESVLRRFEQQITRVQVHVGDENATKQGDKDKRCLIEVKLKGLEPIAVTSHEDSIEKAFHTALTKVHKAMDHALDRVRTH